MENKKEMKDVPNEILAKILEYLRPSERLNCALVNRRWAEILCDSSTLGDVWLVVGRYNIDSILPVLLTSGRRYANLRFEGVTVYEFNAEFWTRIAGDLRSLVFKFCQLSNMGLYSILQECRKLEYLYVSVRPYKFYTRAVFHPPENINVADLQQSLRNVRYLWLQGPDDGNNQFLTETFFNHIFSLMPNVTSLRLANIKRPRGFFTSVVACMERSEQKLVALDLSGTTIDDNTVIRMLDLYRLSLRELFLIGCYQLTSKTNEAITKCTQLQKLSLPPEFTDGQLGRIVFNNAGLVRLEVNLTYRNQSVDDNCILQIIQLKNLKHLCLEKCKFGNEDSLCNLAEMTKLRHLNLRSCELLISTKSLCNLGNLIKLQYLNLSFSAYSVKVFQELASLKDLRVLVLDNCNELNAECLIIICKNFRKLDKIELDLNFTLMGLRIEETGIENFNQLTELRTLKIGLANIIPSSYFENSVRLPDLKVLEMTWCSHAAVIHITTHCVHLQHLSLCGNSLTDVSIEYLVQRLAQLRTLNLTEDELTVRSLEAIRLNCAQLRVLMVKSPLISDDALHLFAVQRPHVLVCDWLSRSVDW